MRQTAPIPAERVRRVVTILHRSGVAGLVDDWTAGDPTAGGRPSRFTPAQVLTALLVAVSDGRPALLTEATDVLLHRLDADGRAALGLTGDPLVPDGLSGVRRRRAERALYAAARRSFHRLLIASCLVV